MKHYAHDDLDHRKRIKVKTLHIAILITGISFSIFSAFGADRIEGAFGKKLGDTFDPASAIGTSQLTDGTPMYEFSTTHGFRSFKRYYVLITPTTRKIYCIWGIGSAENTKSGQKEQALIMEIGSFTVLTMITVDGLP